MMHFVQFWCIGDRLVALRNSVQNGPNWCKSSCHEVASEFFARNAPDPPHWTLSRCFGAFRTIYVHLVPFGCLMELGAKRAEQVQKFVPRSRVGIFHKERTRSTPLDPKLIFWGVSYYLRAFGTVWLPYGTRCKTGRTGGKLRATKSRRNFFVRNAPEPPHWTLNRCFGAFRPICVHLVLFGCLTELGAKRAEQVEKFVQRSRVGIFHKECTRSTPLDPNLMFLCVSYYFGAFRTVWLPYGTRCKTGRTSAKVRATKSRRNFSQGMHPIHPIGP